MLKGVIIFKSFVIYYKILFFVIYYKILFVIYYKILFIVIYCYHLKLLINLFKGNTLYI
jgi:hypothetical protein